MTDALVGHTGFVGGNLVASRPFDELYNSRNVESMRGRTFGELWFSAMPAAKWRANRDPAADLANLDALRRVLDSVECERLVMISTIDVYHDHEPYGAHRRDFEAWMRGRFPAHCVVRLPALFGPGLKKNVIFDLMTGHMVDRIHEGDAYQWYDLADLVDDIEHMRACDVPVADLFTEPLENRALMALFPEFTPTPQDREPRRYDFRSPQAHLFGRDDYVRSAADMLDRLGAFVQNGAEAGFTAVSGARAT